MFRVVPVLRPVPVATSDGNAEQPFLRTGALYIECEQLLVVEANEHHSAVSPPFGAPTLAACDRSCR